MKRAQNKVRRVLMLIDALAQLRMPFTIDDAKYHLEQRSGSSIDVCTRTIQRDMELLVSMDFAEVYRKRESGRGGSAGIVTQYKMNLRTTTSAEMTPKAVVLSLLPAMSLMTDASKLESNRESDR